MAVRTGKNVVFSDAFIQAFVTEWGDDTMSTNGMDNADVRLFTGELVPTPATLLADYVAVEADFIGYVLTTMTDPTAVKVSPFIWAIYHSVWYTASSPYTVGNEITGYWVETQEGALVFGERFEEPLSMAEAGDYLDLNVYCPMHILVTIPDQS